MNDLAVSQTVREYYGEVLKSSKDLKSSACCTLEAMPAFLKKLLADIHPEVVSRFYGCGSPLPPGLEGCTVLDLGCGSGRDCYLLSRLVGPQGRVIGVDMTEAQLEVAQSHLDWHTRRYGYQQANVEFKQGYIEDLNSLGIADNSIDVVVSNCVVNLSPDKKAVFKEIFRVLKPGGELYFADVYSDRRIPEKLRHDPVLFGECLAGALYWEDFRRLLADLGCPDSRVIRSNAIALEDAEIVDKIGMVNFRSVTVRAFKMPLEDRCEDFGQVAIYRGSIPDNKHAFDLDDHHHFETGKPLRVCGNTADMIQLSRYGRHFDISGDKSTHFGLFDCMPPNTRADLDSGSACC